MPKEIIFNGTAILIESDNVAELLRELQITHKKFAVELNRKIVSRADFDTTHLSPNDSVEIVQFVGGG